MSLTKSIADLFLELPFADYLSANEIRDILVTQLEVLPGLSGNDIQRACQSLSKSCLIVSRQHTKAKAKTRYYAATARHETCVLFPDRSADWMVPIVNDVSSERSKVMQKLVQVINSYYSWDPTTPNKETDVGNQEQSEITTTSAPTTAAATPSLKTCRGFRGPKINELFKQSLIDGPLRNFDMNKPFPRSFGLPSCVLATNEGAESFEFVMNEEFCWKLVSKKCEGTHVATANHCAHCSSCSIVSKFVKNICRRILSTASSRNGIDVTRISARGYLQIVAQRPENFQAVLEDIRRRKDKQIENLKHEVQVCRNRLLQAMDNHKESVAVDDLGDLERGQKALEMLKPVISKKYGEKSDYAMVWGQMIAGMCRPIGMAPRYNSQALLFGIELAAQTKADVYDKVASLLNLPPRSHCKRVQRSIIYGKNGCYKSGFQRHTVSLFRNVAKEKGLLKHGPLLVCIAFDCMIMKKNIVLSTRTVDKGKMIGCVASNDLTTLENHFENYVHTVTNLARESGETKLFDDTMTDPFQHNKEHLVCYARCMAPGVDLTFIAGAWNLPACRKIDLVAIVHDVMIGLYSFQFETRVITCDNAQCNEGFLKTMSSLKVNCILPKTILDEYQLSGDMFVAMKHPVNAKPVIYISDPPHCLKRLAGAVRTRDLQYDGCPMTGKLLFDVWQAVQDSYGGDASLIAHRKYKYIDFIDGGGFASMNVASAARLFSATTRAMLDEVGQNPDKYTRLLSTIPKIVDRHKFFSKVSELVTLLNDFFDLCNGKEGSNVFVRFHVHNGEKYQRKFLEVIKWFGDWERSLNIVRGKKNELGRSHFIAAETYRSLKYVCYGFACLIQYECIDNIHNNMAISPCKINQDICEHHFANVRRSCVTHNNPNEVECMSSVLKSAFFRLEKIKKSNCGSIRSELQRCTVPLSLVGRNVSSHNPEEQSANKKKRALSLSRQRSEFGRTSKMEKITS